MSTLSELEAHNDFHSRHLGPNDAEMAGLFSEVQVAATEHLASAAGDLTLGELVTMLGRRADGLAEIWNAWGRVRPVLLDGS